MNINEVKYSSQGAYPVAVVPGDIQLSQYDSARGGLGNTVAPAWQAADPSTDVPPSPFSFSARVGSTLQMPEDSAPVHFFNHVVDGSVMTLIVNETNE